MKRYLLLFILFILSFFSSAQTVSFYKKYYGSIDKYPVVMDLSVIDTACAGWYYYEKSGMPIRIDGTSINGKITLQETDDKGKLTGTFDGTIGQDGSFKGRWLKPAGGELKFALKEDYSHGSMRLRPDAVSTYFEGGKGYAYTYRFMYLLPEGNQDKNVEASITEKLYHISLDGKSPGAAVRSRIQADIDTSLMDYKSALEEAFKDSTGGFSPYMYNWEQDVGMEIKFNERNILTLSMNAYQYSGGAHGSYGTSHYVFNTKTGKEIALEEIFLQGYKDKLAKLLEEQFRQQYQVPAEQSLQEFGLFVDKIEPTNNFCITRNGIGFTFVPYEISPYAMGQITIMLPFSSIESLIDPKGPVGWAVKK